MERMERMKCREYIEPIEHKGHSGHSENCADRVCASEVHPGESCEGERTAQATGTADQIAGAEGQIAGTADQMEDRKIAGLTEITEIVVGMATCGIAAGAEAVFKALEEALKEKGLTDNARVTGTGCLGRCVKEPLVEVIRPGEPPVLYANVTPEKAREIVDRHIANGEVVAELELR